MFCPQCGQDVPPGSGSVNTCLACGTRFAVYTRFGQAAGQPRPADSLPPSDMQPGPRVPRSSPLPGDLPPPQRRGAPVALLIVAGTIFLGAAGAMVAAYSLMSQPGGDEAAANGQPGGPNLQPNRAVQLLRKLGPAVAGASLNWSMTAPAVLDFTGDGVEDVVGAVKPNYDRWVLAGFDGKDMHLLWQTPQFPAENAQVLLQVAGSKVLVLNKKTQQVRIVEPKTGATVAELALTDKPERACASPDNPEQAWVELNDENHQLLDLSKGTATPAGRPAWCQKPEHGAGNIHCHMSQNSMVASCAGTSAAPKLDGTRARLMLVQDNLGVVQAEKSPGTAYARLYGVTLDDQQVHWQASPSEHGDSTPSATRLADLVDGKYVEVVPLQSGNVELVVFDAASGKRLWAKSIANKDSYTDSFAGHAFLVSPKRVYAAVGTFASKLRVFDLASGVEVGSIGDL